MRTALERRLDRIAEAVRGKQHCARKFAGNSALRAKWHQELVEQHDPTAARPCNVFASDDAVPEDLRAQFVDLILDLMNPSLFLVVYNRTRLDQDYRLHILLPSLTATATTIAEAPHETPPFTSTAYQWLPADFAVDESGRTRFTSYINDLHPYDHVDLYDFAMLPLFERMLTRLRGPLPNRTKIIVIVKPANIHLTPETPKYAGDAWHVEVMENERIPPDSPGNEHEEMYTIYRLRHRDQLNEPVGAVTAHHGRVVVFPNTHQHRALPFKLADAARPGHRKIVAFFLVDPNAPVTSAASVPPQQLEWAMCDEALVTAALAAAGEPEGETDAVKAVRAAYPGLMTLDEAKEHRAALMKERPQFAVDHNNCVFTVPFNICEH
ncbi:hypothetical protein H9P43_008999 [Blastocladiella emersonii ATCC 22665]|nr:hypothetical protein H9P43_008999 [Blastocladiella emersonii ATCC 22665]